MGNSSTTITITDAQNNDIFECKADNIIGFDAENTTIYTECGKYIMHMHLVISQHICISYIPI